MQGILITLECVFRQRFLFVVIACAWHGAISADEPPPAREVAQIRLANSLSDVLFSPDAEWLAGSAGFSEVHLVETKTGATKLIVKGHKLGTLKAMAFSRDGKMLLTGGSNNRLRLWKTETAKELLSTESPSVQMAFLPDGKTFVSASDAGEFNWWDIDNKKAPRKTLRLKASLMSQVAFSTDVKTAAGGCYPETIRIFDLAAEKEVRSIKGFEGSIRGLAYSPDGKWLVGMTDKKHRLYVWNAMSGEELNKITDPEKVFRVCFSPDGKWLAAGSVRSLRLWNFESGREVLRVTDLPAGANIGFSPKADQLAVASGAYVYLWALSLERLPKEGLPLKIKATPPIK
jgi:hypothetical protein